jgi:hypothetical protein
MSICKSSAAERRMGDERAEIAYVHETHQLF